VLTPGGESPCRPPPPPLVVGRGANCGAVGVPTLPTRSRWYRRAAAARSDTRWCSRARSTIAARRATPHARAHLGFAEGPVFVAHQAEYGQQLRLGELLFAETTPVGRQNRRGYIHSQASKRQESDFWHRTSCSIRNHHHRSLVLMENRPLCQGCQQSQCGAYDEPTL
jgi:hypothetical protein